MIGSGGRSLPYHQRWRDHAHLQRGVIVHRVCGYILSRHGNGSILPLRRPVSRMMVPVNLLQRPTHVDGCILLLHRHHTHFLATPTSCLWWWRARIETARDSLQGPSDRHRRSTVRQYDMSLPGTVDETAAAPGDFVGALRLPACRSSV